MMRKKRKSSGSAVTSCDMHEWIVDSACDVHVCTDRSLFSSVHEEQDVEFVAWDGSTSTNASLVGDIRVYQGQQHR